MNVVIAGHIDHGKSTLIGRLLYDSGALPESRLSEMQVMAEEYKKKFEFASFMDAFADEVREERTIDTTEVFFKGRHLHTLIDVPGHLEFIEAMLTGASHAEVAILVIDASIGVEEQTRRHLNLLKLLGINNIIVVGNKMDLENYKPLNFMKIGQDSSIVDESAIKHFIPISGSEGENVYTKSAHMGWYTGPPLVELLDKLEDQKKEKTEPLRLMVQGYYKEWMLVSPANHNVKVGDTLCFCPSNIEITVKEIDEGGALRILQTSLLGGWSPLRGEVAGVGKFPFASYKIWGKIFVLGGKIKEGDQFELRCGTARTNGTVTFIVKRIDSETGKEEYNKPLRKHDLGKIEFKKLDSKIFVKRFEDAPELGRFTLIKNNKIAAVGVILDHE